MKEWCSIEELYVAYKDCRKHKTSSYSCANFERKELSNLQKLCDDLNNHTYEIGRSDAFCVTRPKVREVFAAQFRDRIVHHFVIMKTIHLFEAYFIQDTYNCRKGKGTDYGVQRCLEFSREFAAGWVAKCDIQGFFMSIERVRVANDLEVFLRERYEGADIEHLLWLVRLIVLNAPEYNCRKKGNIKLWRLLPRSKSLFTNRKGYGFAIGNLTSQIYANFALCPLDLCMEEIPNIRYGRYVDDFYIYGCTLEDVTTAIQVARDELNKLSLKLHPKKLYIQPVFHGVTFIGTHIKRGRVYSSQRTVGNATNLVRFFNSFKGKEQHIESFTQRFNSYSGYLSHRLTYSIRWNLWNLLNEEVKQLVYIEDMRVLKVKEEYKTNVKLIKSYMIKRRFAKEGWEAIVPAFMKDGKQYYYLRVNPVEDGDDIIATEEVYDHYPTQEDAEQLYNTLLAAAIHRKKVEIEEYSRSSAIKTYLLNGVAGWETSEDRNSISKAASNKADIGRTTYTLYHGGVGFPATPNEVVALMAKVEVYASDCYDVTEQHKRHVEALLNIQDVKDYDYTVGYPEKLHLNV